MTDEKLKHALAKMLPDYVDGLPFGGRLSTEYLHLCALVEKTLGNAQCPTQSQWCQYIIALHEICAEVPAIFATWQQRATALAKVKGIEL